MLPDAGDLFRGMRQGREIGSRRERIANDQGLLRTAAFCATMEHAERWRDGDGCIVHPVAWFVAAVDWESFEAEPVQRTIRHYDDPCPDWQHRGGWNNQHVIQGAASVVLRYQGIAHGLNESTVFINQFGDFVRGRKDENACLFRCRDPQERPARR